MKRLKFPFEKISPSLSARDEGAYVDVQPGEYVAVEITHSAGGNLVGTGLARTSTAEFVRAYGSVIPLKIEMHQSELAQIAGN